MLGKKDAGIEDAIKGLKAIQMDEEKRHAYLRRQMALMDYNTQIKTAREEGIEKEKEAEIPIIAITANASEEDRKKVVEYGMAGLIEKPLEKDAVYKVLEKHFMK